MAAIGYKTRQRDKTYFIIKRYAWVNIFSFRSTQTSFAVGTSASAYLLQSLKESTTAIFIQYFINIALDLQFCINLP